jgi:hypothetical protein
MTFFPMQPYQPPHLSTSIQPLCDNNSFTAPAGKRQTKEMRRNVEVPIGERGRQVYYRLVNLLTNLRCPFFVGGASTAHRRRIHIHQNDLPMFLKSAASEMAHLNAKVYVKSGQAQSLIPLAHFNSFASPPPPSLI